MAHATHPWRDELLIFSGVLAMLWLLGQAVGHSVLAVFTAIVVYLVWHLYHLGQLILWLRNTDARIPKAAGLWDYVFCRLEIAKREDDRSIDELHEQIQEYSQTSQALPFATIALNRQFEISNANKVAARLLNIRRSDRGQTLDNLIREPRFLKYLHSGDYSQPIELPAPRNDERVLSYQLIEANRDQYLLIARDISERRKLEDAQRDFVTNVSHELRTPLTVMQGAVEQIQACADSDPGMAKPVQWIERQTKRMVTLVEDLLNLAALERENASALEDGEHAVNLTLVVNAVLQEAQALSGQQGGHTLNADVQDGIEIDGTYASLRAVVSNLVTNAVRYTPAKGTITVSLQRKPDGVHFNVTDSGAGIAAKHLSRLTERFYRVDEGRSRETGGTGLGLSIVKQVLDHYSSQLEVSSVLGEGSSFGFIVGNEWLSAS